MAITIDCNQTDSIELPEFIEVIDDKYERLTVDTLVESAPYLARLSQNRHFLENIIVEELKDISNFQKDNRYTAQSLMLGGIPGKFYVRANIWLPRGLFHQVNRAGEERLFAYDFAHDHNFDFLTVGYLGGGYDTDIYEYDGEIKTGIEGENVEIEFLESTSLPEHKLMVYRAARDIHIQKLPKEFSISLNLLAPARKPARDQFAFDIDAGKISGILNSNFVGQRLLIEAAGNICNDNVSEILHEIATTHRFRRTREVARRALGIRWPEIAQSISDMAR